MELGAQVEVAAVFDYKVALGVQLVALLLPLQHRPGHRTEQNGSEPKSISVVESIVVSPRARTRTPRPVGVGWTCPCVQGAGRQAVWNLPTQPPPPPPPQGWRPARDPPHLDRGRLLGNSLRPTSSRQGPRCRSRQTSFPSPATRRAAPANVCGAFSTLWQPCAVRYFPQHFPRVLVLYSYSTRTRPPHAITVKSGGSFFGWVFFHDFVRLTTRTPHGGVLLHVLHVTCG